MKVVNSKEFNEIINSKKAVLVDFFATWCGPCRMLAPILEDLEGDANGKFDIIKVDVDESYDLAKKYGIMSVPTMILFVDGMETEKFVGLRQKSDILDTISAYL